MGEGDVGIALLNDVPRTATVTALTPVTYLTLRRDQFPRLVERSPGVRAKIEVEIEARRRSHAP